MHALQSTHQHNTHKNKNTQDRTVQRTYHAIALGTPSPPVGTVKSNITRDLRDRKRMAAAPYEGARYVCVYVFVYVWYVGSMCVCICACVCLVCITYPRLYTHALVPLHTHTTYSHTHHILSLSLSLSHTHTHPHHIPRGKPAVSGYQVIRPVAGGAASYMMWKLQTGRTHQIRVHAKQIGHPLVGDATYGGVSGAHGAWQRAHGGNRYVWVGDV